MNIPSQATNSLKVKAYLNDELLTDIKTIDNYGAFDNTNKNFFFYQNLKEYKFSVNTNCDLMLLISGYTSNIIISSSNKNIIVSSRDDYKKGLYSDTKPTKFLTDGKCEMGEVVFNSITTTGKNICWYLADVSGTLTWVPNGIY